MKYFWKSQFGIPDGMGYPLFGMQHLICLAVIALLIISFCTAFCKIKETARMHCLRAIPFILLFLEIIKDLLLVSQKQFSVGFLPLHLCSFGIPVFLFQTCCRSGKWKSIWGEISFCLIMPGAASALIFPDWTVLYPMFNFFNLHSYLWHTLLVLFPVLLLIHGEIHPSIRHIHWNILFLCCIVPPIYIFDKLTDCNYLFINWPLPDTPLEYLASFLGNPGYLAGYAVLVLAALLAIYVPFSIRRH